MVMRRAEKLNPKTVSKQFNCLDLRDEEYFGGQSGTVVWDRLQTLQIIPLPFPGGEEHEKNKELTTVKAPLGQFRTHRRLS